ncbi:helix-turn-helix domain-containing protein [Mycolicibacterium aurum]|uniref:helix-turn-helix domain-containing protein n=1 Tax=Mycolicibacterium aurum TaxID=1791 RepID=UPI00065E4F7E|nr:helix-turn-helix domain-containing protein [Mycolicibacterium aurum]
MISAQRGVFITTDDAAYIASALDLVGRLLAEQRDEHGHPTPSQPSPRLAATTAKLHRTVASLAVRDSAGDHAQGSEPPDQTTSVRAPQRDSVDAGPHVIGTGEAARRLGITPNAVRDLARRGRLAVTHTGTRWRFDARAVHALAEQRASERR